MRDERGSTHQPGIILRDIAAADLDWLLALNNASVPHVNELAREDLTAIVERSSYARCVLQDGRFAGALIALWPGADYASDHYRWFSRHHSSFLYIDRVMIDGSARKSGHGRRLYADIEAFAREHGASAIACEVNSQPPNPISMAFHQRLGFHPVGELWNDDRSKGVVMMMKAFDGAPEGA